MTLPGNAAFPAADARRNRLAQLSGRRIVDMVNEDLCPSAVLTDKAFANAIRVVGAIGGSTNAVIHLLAIAGRIGVDLSLDDWDRLGRDVFLRGAPEGLRTDRKTLWQCEWFALVQAYGQVNARTAPVVHMVRERPVMTLDSARAHWLGRGGAWKGRTYGA